MSAEPDDDRRKGLAAWLPWLVTAAVVALLAIALITSGGDSSSDSAAQPPAATTTAPATTDDGTATAPADAGTTEGSATPIPEEVQSDPVVKRLAHGRSLPFTAGPWRKETWRDAVYARLRPATQQRAEKVAADGGFGILIQ